MKKAILLLFVLTTILTLNAQNDSYVFYYYQGKKILLKSCRNKIFESGLFEFSEPEFVWMDAFCSDDTFFSSQWGLSNTGQNGGVSGIDINVSNAWNITKGNTEIITSVID